MRKVNDFLKYGALPKFWLGLSFEEFSAIIGEEKLGKRWYYDTTDKTTYAYFYKGIEFSFLDDKICIINLDVDGRKRFYVETEKGEKRIIFPNTTLYQIIEILNQSSINWRFYPRYCFNHQLTLLTEGNVIIQFGFSDKEKLSYIFKLHKSELSFSPEYGS
ncbi:hypothetical protein [Xanthocytophaga agilis]|uniref:Uncharacterized protein n=1 Tax=Xanthocytophaga agilis TaxID=3048010 RepID=A0AAE3RA58_9BACT|nr:hypothetical protein [Xanthocytophaga agilis]MDJ1504325.1 hypothetical protein [Xanthocytophaga agilis]